MAEKWTETKMELPPNGLLVMTKMDDEKGVRNEQPLKRAGNLFFVEDGSMYVYYTPTHWRHLSHDEAYDRVLTERKSIIQQQARLAARLEELDRSAARMDTSQL